MCVLVCSTIAGLGYLCPSFLTVWFWVQFSPPHLLSGTQVRSCLCVCVFEWPCSPVRAPRAAVGVLSADHKCRADSRGRGPISTPAAEDHPTIVRQCHGSCTADPGVCLDFCRVCAGVCRAIGSSSPSSALSEKISTLQCVDSLTCGTLIIAFSLPLLWSLRCIRCGSLLPLTFPVL